MKWTPLRLLLMHNQTSSEKDHLTLSSDILTDRYQEPWQRRFLHRFLWGCGGGGAPGGSGGGASSGSGGACRAKMSEQKGLHPMDEAACSWLSFLG